MRGLLLSLLVPVSVQVQDQAELPLEVELAMARVLVPPQLLEVGRVLKPELEVLVCEEGPRESYGR